mgnify:CR=1 FL=1
MIPYSVSIPTMRRTLGRYEIGNLGVAQATETPTVRAAFKHRDLEIRGAK